MAKQLLMAPTRCAALLPPGPVPGLSRGLLLGTGSGGWNKMSPCLQRVGERDGSGAGGECERPDPAGSGAAGLCPAARLVRVGCWGAVGVRDRLCRAGGGTRGERQQSWQGREQGWCTPPGSIPRAMLLSLSAVPNPFPGAMRDLHPYPWLVRGETGTFVLHLLGGKNSNGTGCKH